LQIFVTKANGSKQLYNKEKVVKTSLRLGASRDEADRIASKIESKLYDGIPTRRILQLIFVLLRKPKPSVGHIFDLRRGISLMESKPEFEMFIRILLANSGYTVTPNTILRGLCGEHEADALASKDDLTYFVEVKHHSSYHSLTGLDESRIARAIVEDVTEGYIRGVSEIKIDGAMIVTNTRYSKHAINYGRCRDIIMMGWASPENGLRELIEANKLYPLSCLRGISKHVRLRLVDEGIVLIKQLMEQDVGYLERKLGLTRQAVSSIMEKAQQTTETLWI
jgi:hypothetical protein